MYCKSVGYISETHVQSNQSDLDIKRTIKMYYIHIHIFFKINVNRRSAANLYKGTVQKYEFGSLYSAYSEKVRP